MGLFTPMFTREGKGVDKDAPEKNRFFLFFELFFNHFFSLVTLNFVYCVTMIPLFLGIIISVDFSSGWPFKLTGDMTGLILLAISLFTSFPMTAGFTFVLRNIQRREHAWIVRDMFKHAKLNYKKAVINGLVQIVIYFLLYNAFVVYRYMYGNELGLILSYVIILCFIIFMWMQYYMNLMIVTFDLGLKHIYKNALIFAIAKFPINLLITIICLAIITLCTHPFIPPFINLLLLAAIYLSLLGFITIFGIYPSVDKAMISNATDKTEQMEI